MHVDTVTHASAAMAGLGAGTASAAGWPPLQTGGHLYTGPTGTGEMVTVDLDDLGTCHTLAQAARSVQVVSGSASLELFPGADCTGATSWRTGSLAQSDLPRAMSSYRVVVA
ncbi:hypothetical protein [Streptomyces dioscori]|nr:hypothetical protein [Streptomyces dioscori]